MTDPEVVHEWSKVKARASELEIKVLEHAELRYKMKAFTLQMELTKLASENIAKCTLYHNIAQRQRRC